MMEGVIEMTKDVRELGEQWALAELRGDASALEAMLADDFVGVGPRGFVLTKEQWLDRYRSGDLAHTTFTWEDVRVREHGPSAVAIGVQVQESKYKGQPMSGKFRVTQFFVNEDGRWLLEGIHMSPMAEAPVAART